MKRTPLYETHHTLGAKFAEMHEGWELVAHFTDAREEHHAVRKGVGILDLSHRGRFSLTGEDRAKYLHRIISNDAEQLEVGQGNYATILTNRGKIIADMHVYVSEGQIHIETNAETTERLYKELDKYLIADDVTIEDLTDKSGSIGVHGPTSALLLEKAFALDVHELGENHVVWHKVGDRRFACTRSNETGEVGYNLHAKASLTEWVWDTLMKNGRDFDAKPVGLTALNSLRIEAGIPRYGSELGESIIPLEAELEHAIDFTKGGYIGQEIVARMKYRGHPNRLLRGFEIDHETPPEQGARIFNGEKEIGWMTSALSSPTLGKTIALGYVRIAFTDEGSKIEVETADGRVNATVKLLPFTNAMGNGANQ